MNNNDIPVWEKYTLTIEEKIKVLCTDKTDRWRRDPRMEDR